MTNRCQGFIPPPLAPSAQKFDSDNFACLQNHSNLYRSQEMRWILFYNVNPRNFTSRRNSSERRLAKLTKHDTEQQFAKKIRSRKRSIKNINAEIELFTWSSYFLLLHLLHLLNSTFYLPFSSTSFNLWPHCSSALLSSLATYTLIQKM